MNVAYKYKGIDYGLRRSNIDLETGIRYGVINQNAVGQAWFDDSEGYYGKPRCPDCDNEVDKTIEFSVDEKPVFDAEDNEIEDEYYCSICDKGVDENNPDIWCDEALSFFYDQDGYQAECSDDYGDIFVMKSPYFTFAQFCSPCAPGAVHLENPLDHKNDDNKGYCFGHDWFEGKAPYPVYSVETGKLVE